MSGIATAKVQRGIAPVFWLLLTGCISAQLELDKMTNTSFPPDRYVPPGASGPDDHLSIPRIFRAGGRLVATNEDDDIPTMAPLDHCITIDELEDLVLTYRDDPTSPTSHACYGGFTCTDHHVYGAIIGYDYGGSTGACQHSKVGFIGDPANRGVFFVFQSAGGLMSSERNFLKATAHELGHTFNLHHEDAEDGSLMTDGLHEEDFFFSPRSQTHLTDHPEDKVWPNMGAFDDFTNAHAQGHAAMAMPDSALLAAGPELELLLTVEPPRPRLGEPFYLVARLRNGSSTVASVPAELGPEVGTLQIAFTDPAGTPATYLPLSFEDSLAPPRNLQPGGEVTTTVALFFGGRGWTFGQAGTYRITGRFTDASKRTVVVSEPLSLTVAAADAAGARLLRARDASHEAGKLLAWLGGDHLRKGISELKDLIADYPRSPLADYARLALGVALSRDVFSFSLGKVRRSECWSARHYLEAIDPERLPIYPRIRRDLALAHCLLRDGQPEKAGVLVTRAQAAAAERDDLRRLADGLIALHQLSPSP